MEENSKYIKSLSKEDLNFYTEYIEEKFYMDNNEHFYNIHDIIKNYAKNIGLPIYDRIEHSSNLSTFIDKNSTLKKQMLHDFILEEKENKERLEEEENDYYWYY